MHAGIYMPTKYTRVSNGQFENASRTLPGFMSVLGSDAFGLPVRAGNLAQSGNPAPVIPHIKLLELLEIL